MSNKIIEKSKKILTAADLARVNSRNDDSLSFVSGGQLLTEENRSDHKTRIITTSDGKVWVQPASGGSEIDLTQTSLSTEQIQSIDSLPEMKDSLRKELELINERGNTTVKENDIQNQRLDALENDVKQFEVVEKNVERLNEHNHLLTILDERTTSHKEAFNSLRTNNALRVHSSHGQILSQINITLLSGESYETGYMDSTFWRIVGDSDGSSSEAIFNGIRIGSKGFRYTENPNSNIQTQYTGNRRSAAGASSGDRFVLAAARGITNLEANRWSISTPLQTALFWNTDNDSASRSLRAGGSVGRNTMQVLRNEVVIFYRRPLSSVFVQQTLGVNTFGYTNVVEIKDEKEKMLEDEYYAWNKKHEDIIDEFYKLENWIEYYKLQKLNAELDDSYTPQPDNIYKANYKNFNQLKSEAKIKLSRFNKIKDIKAEHDRVWELKSIELETYKEYLRENNLIKKEFTVYNPFEEVIDTYIDFNPKENQVSNICPIKFLENHIRIKNQYSEEEIKEKINQLKEIVLEEKKQGMHK